MIKTFARTLLVVNFLMVISVLLDIHSFGYFLGYLVGLSFKLWQLGPIKFLGLIA